MRIRFEEYKTMPPVVDTDRGRLSRKATSPDHLTISLRKGYNDREELAKLIAFGAQWRLETPKGEALSSDEVVVAADGSLSTPMGKKIAIPEELKEDEAKLIKDHGKVLDEIIQAFDAKGRVPIEYDVKYPAWNFTRRRITVRK